VDFRDQMLGSLDHEILRGSPPVHHWQPGDEGYEARYLALPAAEARDARVHIGLFHPDTGLRVPLWVSTYPLKDDFTAAVITPNRPPPAGYAFQMSPGAPVPADVLFEDGIRLTGYSIARAGDAAWLRLHWSIPRGERRRLYFFGHAVASQSPDTAILLSFDHDLGVDRLPRARSGGPLNLVQDIVRDTSKLSPGGKFIRAGVFDLNQPLDRLSVLSSSIPSDPKQKAIFLPLP
jgi:hypothetical protein